MNHLGGLQITESEWMTEPGPPVTVKRTWRERLFSGYCPECNRDGWALPWAPWWPTRQVTGPQVPRKDVLVFGGRIVGHPATIRRLMAATPKPTDYDARTMGRW